MRILVTGGAGFIGSHIAENLLNDNRVTHVRVLDNLNTGNRRNIEEFKLHEKFQFMEGDITNYETCLQACDGIDMISHQAAMGSVPYSIDDPLTSNEINITGTLNIFTAAREKKVKRVIYASSSATYGDQRELPNVEDKTGNLLTPYAVTKYVSELYARVYGNLYNLELIGLRYFNIFGPKQNPNGPYAAVIPLFIEAILSNKAPTINGDGEHSRDFTFVSNVVMANISALFTDNKDAINQVYNIACGSSTSLNSIYELLKKEAGSTLEPMYGPERTGDIKHSLADISKAKKLLGYSPEVTLEEGLKKTFQWYKQKKHLDKSQNQLQNDKCNKQIETVV